jgi:hypothetical protein
MERSDLLNSSIFNFHSSISFRSSRDFPLGGVDPAKGSSYLGGVARFL